jgi:hypothetical protein
MKLPNELIYDIIKYLPFNLSLHNKLGLVIPKKIIKEYYIHKVLCNFKPQPQPKPFLLNFTWRGH